MNGPTDGLTHWLTNGLFCNWLSCMTGEEMGRCKCSKKGEHPFFYENPVNPVVLSPLLHDHTHHVCGYAPLHQPGATSFLCTLWMSWPVAWSSSPRKRSPKGMSHWRKLKFKTKQLPPMRIRFLQSSPHHENISCLWTKQLPIRF